MSLVDNFEILEEIGHGAYSKVHICRHVPTNNYAAVKIVDLTNLKKFEFNGIMREVSVFMQVDHPNLTSFYHLTYLDEHVYFFMEFAPGGTLLEYVNQEKGLKEPEARRLFVQMFSAMRHLHVYNFLSHRDLKLENVLLDSKKNAKITDFGFAGTHYMNMLRTFVGTRGYTAPEVLSGAEYDEKCDVWSLGICLYAMVTASLPFTPTTESARVLIDQAQAFKFPSKFTPGLTDLLKKMLEVRPAQRPTLIQLQHHPWLKGIATIPMNVAPKPVVFYQIKDRSQIAKFRRQYAEFEEKVFQKMIPLGFNEDEVKKIIETGEVNDISATYYILRKPLSEKPIISKKEPEEPIVEVEIPPVKKETSPTKITPRKRNYSLGGSHPNISKLTEGDMKKASPFQRTSTTNLSGAKAAHTNLPPTPLNKNPSVQKTPSAITKNPKNPIPQKK